MAQTKAPWTTVLAPPSSVARYGARPAGQSRGPVAAPSFADAGRLALATPDAAATRADSALDPPGFRANRGLDADADGANGNGGNGRGASADDMALLRQRVRASSASAAPWWPVRT